MILRLLFLTTQNCNNPKLCSYLTSTEIPQALEDLQERINGSPTPSHVFVANAILDLLGTLRFFDKRKMTPHSEEKAKGTALRCITQTVPLIGCSNPMCQFTKKDTPNRSMSKCTGCMSVQYCDRSCQIK